jgi:hypothetical protein
MAVVMIVALEFVSPDRNPHLVSFDLNCALAPGMVYEGN